MSDAQAQPGLRRITVNLTPAGGDALTAAAQRLRINQTDTVDRALRVYDFLLEQTARGAGELQICRPDGTTDKLTLLP